MSGAAAIILAAGRSTRYRAAGGAAATKLVASLAGEALVRHVARAALASLARPVIVVTGHARDRVEPALAGLDLTFVHNQDFADGLATSLRAGLAAVPEGADAAVVLLGDMPLIDPATIDALVEAAARNPAAQAVVPTWGGVRGNPVLLRRTLFPAASALTGDEGARRLLRDPSIAVTEFAVTNEAVRLDVDDPDSLARAAAL